MGSSLIMHNDSPPFIHGTLKESLTLAINSASLISSPYDHFRMEEIFPAELYAALIQQLPDKSFYQPIPHRDAKISENESTRLVMPLSREYLLNSALSEDKKRFWMQVSEECDAISVKDAVFSKLQHDLFERFGIEPKDIPVTLKLQLYKDVTGYKIRPHRDNMAKVVTLQIYLPMDHQLEFCGTCIYKSQGNEEMEKIKKFPFVPNSGYSFAVSNKSWHGVETITQEGIERNSLMLFWVLKDSFLA